MAEINGKFDAKFARVSEVTVAYVMNKHVEDNSRLGQRGIEIVCAAYDSLNAVDSKSAVA